MASGTWAVRAAATSGEDKRDENRRRRGRSKPGYAPESAVTTV